MDDKNKQAEREHADRLFKRLPDETIEQHLDRFSAGINAAQEQAEPVANHSRVCLSGAQLLEALDFIAPDRDTDREQLESDVTIQYGGGHDGTGYYCWVSDYPEEGAILLDGEGASSILAAPAPTASPDTVGVILEMREQAREARQSDPDAGIFADHAYADLLDEWANRLERHDGRMSGLVRDYIEGMSVSIDVSTGEHDAGNRYYGFVSEVMDDPDDKHGVTLLVQDDVRPNFKASASPANQVGWQPIETAPKDREVWAFNGEQGRMQWSEGSADNGEGWALWVWCDPLLSDADPEPEQPTHFMPLPADPVAAMSASKEGA